MTLKDRSMTIKGRVVEAMWKIYKNPDLRKEYMKVTDDREEREYMLIDDIRKIMDEIMDYEDTSKRKRNELSVIMVASLIRSMKLQVGQRQNDGIPVYWNKEKMRWLAIWFWVKMPEVAL